MPYQHQLPIAVPLSDDIEYRPGRYLPYRARVRWIDPATKRRRSLSQMQPTAEAAQEWINELKTSAARGIDPATSNQTLAEYGNAQMQLALRGLEPKTTDPYLAGWRLRVVPALGHLPLTAVTNGAVDRTVYAWIADGEGRSTVKNSLAILVRVMEQAVRDGLITVNPARVKGWQRQYQLAEDELDDPRSLALRDWNALTQLASALVARSYQQYTGWGEAVVFAACTAARIGEVSGVRVKDIDRHHWIWSLRRQTTPSPGGLADKNTKGKVARRVPLIEEIRPMIARRLLAVGDNPDARLFTGPRGGRITTAILRDATHWDDVVRSLGYEHLRRHDLRHTGLTWMADAGVPLHVLRLIAGHGNLQTTQRYLHPDLQSVVRAGQNLSGHLTGVKTPPPPTPGLSATLRRL
ncbi:Site-specific recombinase XerC [Actinacidiphila rubida]|uniref:Site-specific recombinase XerC n=2 Tax=Actinacidiphila rubida TaxID=310780 RepID=A0A1H8T105_9ACTN|nr:site-specific integrase [Actinacidiphila rubida]SEO84670.1 Site-specific recombinase XerC [Actinacidiphila rubida]